MVVSEWTNGQLSSRNTTFINLPRGDFIFPHMEEAIAQNTIYGLDKKVKRIPLYFEDDMWVSGVATLVVRDGSSFPAREVRAALKP
jgi:hypothetical protein